MRKAAIALVICTTVIACTASTPTATPSASASSTTPVAAVPQITPAPVGPPTRILWAPMQPQPLSVAVRVEPSVAAAAPVPALVPATSEQLKSAEKEFVARFTERFGFVTTLQSLRDQRYNGGEEWMFTTNFAPGPFADHVRELITTHRENEIRTFNAGEASLENAWVRPSTGPFGNPANVSLVQGTVTFTDEVVTGGGRTIETHQWRLRALSQGQFFILDGVEDAGALTPVAPFDQATLDGELATWVAAHLHEEEVGPSAMPMAPFQSTAYWNARKGALDWLHELAARGSLTDRHFEDMRAQVTQYRPTSYLGDGFITVQLHGTLAETMNGARHTYPVNESVVFQRFSFAQAYWLAVDGQNSDGSWIANGSYGTPQPTAHG